MAEPDILSNDFIDRDGCESRLCVKYCVHSVCNCGPDRVKPTRQVKEQLLEILDLDTKSQ